MYKPVASISAFGPYPRLGGAGTLPFVPASTTGGFSMSVKEKLVELACLRWQMQETQASRRTTAPDTEPGTPLRGAESPATSAAARNRREDLLR